MAAKELKAEHKTALLKNEPGATVQQHKTIIGQILDAVLGVKDPSGGRPAGGRVDVEDVLRNKAEAKAKNGERLDWRYSIVDLLKLLDLPSDLEARERLADCFGYASYSSDVNLWLYKRVLKELGKSGGLVPHAWL